MSEALTMDKDDIDKSSEGWIDKVERLYSEIKDALKNDLNVVCKSEQHMLMQEGLMQKHGVPPKQVPILDLFVGDKLKATFKPIGRWVIGANGRIDIITQEGAYILVDLGEDGAHPDWKVFTPKNRRKGIKFNSKFIEMLTQGT